MYTESLSDTLLCVYVCVCVTDFGSDAAVRCDGGVGRALCVWMVAASPHDTHRALGGKLLRGGHRAVSAPVMGGRLGGMCCGRVSLHRWNGRAGGRVFFYVFRWCVRSMCVCPRSVLLTRCVCAGVRRGADTDPASRRAPADDQGASRVFRVTGAARLGAAQHGRERDRRCHNTLAGGKQTRAPHHRHCVQRALHRSLHELR